MGCTRKQISSKYFILLLALLMLAGCGGSKEVEKKEKVNPSNTPTIIQGYRVQLFSTSEIDDANAKKARAEAAFPDEWFYVVYDAPRYKLRGGNFVNRSSADAFAKHLTEKGFPDAWTVPEKILKNPQPRTQVHSENQK